MKKIKEFFKTVFAVVIISFVAGGMATAIFYFFNRLRRLTIFASCDIIIMLHIVMCRCDGIGRRAGLKIRW